MAQFQPPNFVQPQQYPSLDHFGDTLDNAFNMSIRMRLAQQEFQKNQLAMQNQQAQSLLAYGGFGFGPQDVTPQNIRSASQPQATYPDIGQGQGLYQNPGGPMPEADPIVDGIRRYMAMQLLRGQLGIQGEQAGIAEKTGAARKSSAEAALDNLKFNLLGGDGSGGRNNAVTGTVDQVQSGRLAPSDMFDAAGRDPLVRLAMQNEVNRRGLDQQTLENVAERRKSLATAGAIPTANTNTLLNALNVLDQLNQAVPREHAQIINKGGLAAAAALNTDAGHRANMLLNQANIVSDLFQMNFGSGSDKKLDLAAKLVDPKQSTTQMADTLRLMRADANIRISAFAGQPGTARPDLGLLTPGNKAGATAQQRTFKGKPVIPLGNGRYQVIDNAPTGR